MAMRWLERLTARLGSGRLLGARGGRRVADAVAAGFPPAWRLLLAQRLATWHLLSTPERERLEHLVLGFLATKDLEAARDFEVTPEMRVLIAAQAVLPLLGVAREQGVAEALDHYRDVDAVVVHPTTVVTRGERPTQTPRVMTDEPAHLLGQAQLYGPVLLAWDSIEASLAAPGNGRNVVLHEFAHKLDMRDGAVDGTPMLGDAAARRRWHDLATAELALLRRRPDPVLRRYGARNPAEFFAVVVEAFLDAPVQLWEHKPELYDVLVALFRQDPAARHLRLLPVTA